MPAPTPDPSGRASDGQDIHIRPAAPADADGVADVFLSAFRATYDFPLVHTDDQVRQWLRGYVAKGSAWVAVARSGMPGAEPATTPASAPRAVDPADLVVGFLGLEGHELDQLYVRPGWWRRGIGSRLVELAKGRSPDGLALWTLQVNAGARRFYERHGFAVVRLTGGEGNEERQPDVRYGWLPESSVVRGWDAVYAGRPPWDIGRPQSAFRALAEAGELRGRVLDVGCGTGEHTLLAAGLGLDATGIDIAASALAIAREKAADRALRARFLAWDATQLPILGEHWETVLDSGVFHVFDDAARARYVASLSAVVQPGGRYHMLVFSDRQGGNVGPRRIRQDEIRDAFADGWSVLSIEPAVLETNAGFDPASGGGPAGAKAWLAAIERR
jgi:SAM-dependent methyltransferase/GNAT superfamily N-acetyltransferase